MNTAIAQIQKVVRIHCGTFCCHECQYSISQLTRQCIDGKRLSAASILYKKRMSCAHMSEPTIYRAGVGCRIHDITDKTDCLCQPVCHEETITVPFIHRCIVQISYNPKNIAAKINDYCRVHNRYHIIKRGLYIVMDKTACNSTRAPVYTEIEHYCKKQRNATVFWKYSVKKTVLFAICCPWITRTSLSPFIHSLISGSRSI